MEDYNGYENPIDKCDAVEIRFFLDNLDLYCFASLKDIDNLIELFYKLSIDPKISDEGQDMFEQDVNNLLDKRLSFEADTLKLEKIIEEEFKL